MSVDRTEPRESAMFDPRVLVGLVAIGVACLIGVVYFGALGDFDSRVGRADNNSFSTSAVGHGAFVELLKRRGYTIVTSRGDSLEKARGGVLLRLEPDANDLEQALAADAEGDWNDAPILIALPKRIATADPFDRDRARRVWLLREERPQEILDILSIATTIGRPDEKNDRANRSGRLARQVNRLGVSPTLSEPQLLNLFDTSGVLPVVAGPDGALVIERIVGGRTIYLLSDPDIIANHGIDDGDNAALAMALIERVAGSRTLIVVDETIHGFQVDKDFWRLAFSPPYLGIALAGAILLSLMAWRALARFGVPVPTPRPFGSGKAALIRNTRDLLLFGGYGADGLARYRDAVLRDVSAQANVPLRRQEPDMEALSRLRGGMRREAFQAALRATDRALAAPKNVNAAVEAARALAQWKKDILHGR